MISVWTGLEVNNLKRSKTVIVEWLHTLNKKTETFKILGYPSREVPERYPRNNREVPERYARGTREGSEGVVPPASVSLGRQR